MLGMAWSFLGVSEIFGGSLRVQGTPKNLWESLKIQGTPNFLGDPKDLGVPGTLGDSPELSGVF